MKDCIRTYCLNDNLNKTITGQRPVKYNTLPRVRSKDSEIDDEYWLLHAVIRSAILEHDTEYFNSITFEKHCEAFGIRSELIKPEILENMKDT